MFLSTQIPKSGGGSLGGPLRDSDQGLGWGSLTGQGVLLGTLPGLWVLCGLCSHFPPLPAWLATQHVAWEGLGREGFDSTSWHPRHYVRGHLPHFLRICWQLPPGGPPGGRHAGAPCSRTQGLQQIGALCRCGRLLLGHQVGVEVQDPYLALWDGSCRHPEVVPSA